MRNRWFHRIEMPEMDAAVGNVIICGVVCLLFGRKVRAGELSNCLFRFLPGAYEVEN